MTEMTMLKYARKTFCALDFETANPRRGSVCGIGVARFDAVTGELLARDGGLVTPPRVTLPDGYDLSQFSRANMMVHHINPRKIKAARDGQGAATWGVVLPWLIDFVGNDMVMAHNAPFERSVLREASLAIGTQVPTMTNRVACTVKISRAMLPDLERHKLPFVVEALGLAAMGERHHDALADAVACGNIVAALLRRGHDVTTLLHNSGQHDILRAIGSL